MKIFHTCALMAALVSGLALQASDLPMLKTVCESCHGQVGVSTNPYVPTIAGQAYTFIEDGLLAYRSNQRSCYGGPSEITSPMCAIASTLDDEAIAALAAHYERQPFLPAKQDFDESLTSRGEALHRKANCELCHSDGGRESNGMAAILAGQWSPYLAAALQQIRAGERQGPKVMNEAIRSFSDEDIRALLSYYASRQE